MICSINYWKISLHGFHKDNQNAKSMFCLYCKKNLQWLESCVFDEKDEKFRFYSFACESCYEFENLFGNDCSHVRKLRTFKSIF